MKRKCKHEIFPFCTLKKKISHKMLLRHSEIIAVFWNINVDYYEMVFVTKSCKSGV